MIFSDPRMIDSSPPPAPPRLIDPATGVPFNVRPTTTGGMNGQSNGRVGGYSDEGYGNQFPLPHPLLYNAILSSGDKAYWHDRWDEAMRHSRESALVMRRDAFLMSLHNERRLAVASLPWDLEIPDEKNDKQRLVRDVLKRAIENIVDFRKMMWALLDAIWYGRYAVELKWGWIKIQGARVMTVVDWIPINGDKLGWNFNGVPYILVNSGAVTPRPDTEIINTTAGGRGLLLKGTWRDHFIIHRHEIDDGDYFDPEAAAGVWGVGLRSRIFWMDWIRREYLEWITTFLERVGLGVTLWYFDGGNPAAFQAVQLAAKNQSRRANLFVPIFPDGKGSNKGLVERIETPVNGVDALRMLKEDIEQKIERLYVGQEASSKGSGSTGLGNQTGASFQWQTKELITKWDALNIAECLTGDSRNPSLVYWMQKATFPDTMPERENGFRVKMKVGIENRDGEKKLRAGTTIVGMGLPIKADEVYEAGGYTTPDVGDKVVEPPQMGGAPGEAQPALNGGQPQPPAAPGQNGQASAPGPGPGRPPNDTKGNPGTAPKEFEPPYTGADEYRRGYFQYAIDNATIAKDMITRKNNAAMKEPSQQGAPAGWSIYHGTHGGTGWKNSLTGKIIYATSGRSPFKTRAGSPGGKEPQDPKQVEAIMVRRRRNAHALAKWYADHWNLMHELGLTPGAQEKHEAGLELYGSGIAIWHDEKGDGKWKVIPLNKENTGGGAVQYAAERAPKGYTAERPLVIQGRSFIGGQWVPKEFVEAASPQQRAELQQSHVESQQKRMGKGPVNEGAMRDKIKAAGEGAGAGAGSPHVGVMGDVAAESKAAGELQKHHLLPHERRHARQVLNGTMRHHGEMTANRLSEHLDDTEKILNSVPEGSPLREKLVTRMEQIGEMINEASLRGMMPEVAPGHEDKEPSLEATPQAAEPKPQAESPQQEPKETPREETPEDQEKSRLADNVLKRKLDDGLKASTHIPEEVLKQYRETHEAVMDRMNDKARERINANVGRYIFSGTPEELQQSLAKEYTDEAIKKEVLSKDRLIGGAYSFHGDGKRRIHQDGNDPRFTGEHMDHPQKIAAHEYGHAIDGPNFEYSKSPEWQEAYQDELSGGQLSAYASSAESRKPHVNQSEGFAEFSRALHSGQADMAQLKQQFPKSWAFWEKQGLLPPETGGTEGPEKEPPAGGASPADKSPAPPKDYAAEIKARSDAKIAESDRRHAERMEKIKSGDRAAAKKPETPAAEVVADKEGRKGYFELNVGGKRKGIINLGEPTTKGGDTSAASRMFPGVTKEGESVSRIHGVDIDKDMRGKGLGQQLYLQGMLQNGADWYYNSQTEPPATNVLKAMQKKGLIDLHWYRKDPGYDENGGIHLVRLTGKGREMAKAGENKPEQAAPPSGMAKEGMVASSTPKSISRRSLQDHRRDLTNHANKMIEYHDMESAKTLMNAVELLRKIEEEEDEYGEVSPIKAKNDAITLEEHRNELFHRATMLNEAHEFEDAKTLMNASELIRQMEEDLEIEKDSENEDSNSSGQAKEGFVAAATPESHPFYGKTKDQVVKELVNLSNPRTVSSDPLGYASDVNSGWRMKSADQGRVEDQIIKSIREQKQRNRFQNVNLKQAFDFAKAKNPGLTLSDFQRQLVKMKIAGKIRLGPYTQAVATHENPEMLLPIDRELKWYIEGI